MASIVSNVQTKNPMGVVDVTSDFRRRAAVINEGTPPGFISIDGGDTWFRMPAGPATRSFDLRGVLGSIKIVAKRVPSGSDMTGLWADGY